MVEIEIRCKIPIWHNLSEFNGMSSHSRLPYCRVLPLGEFTVTIPEPHATLQGAVIWRNQCHIAGCKYSAVMWSKSKSDVKFQYGGHLSEFNGMSSKSHLPHCRVLPLGEFTVTIPEPHATLQGAVTWRNQCHIAGCKYSICPIENRFSPYFIFFCF